MRQFRNSSISVPRADSLSAACLSSAADFVAKLARLGFFRLGLRKFLLAHQRADFLAHPVPL